MGFLFKIMQSILGEKTVITNPEKDPITDSDTSGTVSPIYDFLDTFGPFLIALILAVGVIYSLVLGIQYAKAEKGDDRDIAKKKMVNAMISFGVIVILIVVLYAMRGTFVELTQK